MPFSEKQSVVLSLLTLVLLVALLVYAGGLSPAAHAATPHRKPSESVAEVAAIIPSHPESETLRTMASHDAGSPDLPDAVATSAPDPTPDDKPPAASPDGGIPDLFTRLLLACSRIDGSCWPSDAGAPP